MITNRVSTTLSTSDQEAVLAAIGVIEQKLSFLIDLTTAERVQMAKLGDRSEGFVRKAVEIGSQHSDLFAQSFLQEMRRDADLWDRLGPIRTAIDRIQKRVDDTVTQLGAEAFAAARTVYAISKTPFAEAAMRTAAGDLGKRFGRRPRVAPAADPPVNSKA